MNLRNARSEKLTYLRKRIVHDWSVTNWMRIFSLKGRVLKK